MSIIASINELSSSTEEEVNDLDLGEQAGVEPGEFLTQEESPRADTDEEYKASDHDESQDDVDDKDGSKDEEEEEEDDDNIVVLDDLYSWMQQGTKIIVKLGKQDIPYPAKIMEEPVFQNGQWTVQVKWDGYSSHETVECSQCEPIDLSTEQDGKRRFPRRMTTTTKEPPGDDEEESTKRSKKQPPVAAAVSPDRTSASVGAESRAKKQSKAADGEFEKARQALCEKPGMTEKEVLDALRKVGPPYGLQTVMHTIEEARKAKSVWTEPQPGKFRPEIGMAVRKYAEGYEYHGKITADPEYTRVEEGKPLELTWEVTFEGGIVDDMTWDELFQCRLDRPRNPAPCRGRQLCCLELFAGQAIVAQEFCDRKWKVASLDSDQRSNATMKMDILKIDPSKDLEFVPDFIWASLPCETYSNLAGGAHRNKQHFELSEKSRQHNFLFTKMAEIMYWAREKHPHLVVVIENPVGSLKSMPLMKEFTDRFGLYNTTVHYCAFGRHDKKPTVLWTNDFGLKSTLSEFTCDNKCPYSRGAHPLGVRTHGSRFNAAAIPQPLAEEVAEYMNAKFYQDRIRYKPAIAPDE